MRRKKSDLLYDPMELKQADKWREYYNPLRTLRPGVVLAWLQQEQLGIVSNITWLYRFVEERDATLSALIDRRTSAMEKLDWDIKETPEAELPEGFTPADAKKQATELRRRYANLDNLREAINFLALASFRRFAHLEKHYDGDGTECHLEPVPQWNWARSGMRGDWWYNQRAVGIPGPLPGTQPTSGLQPIDPANFIIREVERPIDVIAVFCFLRKNMSQKDWDAFIEVFGVPPIFIEMPPDMPVEKQAEYQAVAENIVADTRGTLPAGSKVQTVAPGSNSGNPFAEHLRYQDEQIVLKGTGGLLTMLTQSGSGTLAGHAHQDTFDGLAEAEARRISEIFQEQFDQPVLDEMFPTQPKLAWFELAAKELTETSKVVTDVSGLANGGYEVDPDQIEEKTGYRVSLRDPVSKTAIRAEQGDPSVQKAPATENRARLRDLLTNRSDDRDLNALIRTLGEHIDDATDTGWAPIMDRLEDLLASPDDQFVANARAFIDDIPKLAEPTKADAATVKGWQEGLNAALFNGLADESKKPAKKARSKKVAK